MTRTPCSSFERPGRAEDRVALALGRIRERMERDAGADDVVARARWGGDEHGVAGGQERVGEGRDRADVTGAPVGSQEDSHPPRDAARSGAIPG